MNAISIAALPACFLPYAFSLRRTEPRERRGWWLLTWLGLGLGLLLALVGVTASHVTLAGATAAVLAPAFVLSFCALGVEVNAAAGNGVHRYRQRVADEARKRLEPPLQWEAGAFVPEYGENVEIRVRRGDVERLVGAVDPIEDEPAFHAMMARAQEMAATLNALGVKTSSKALVRQ